MARKTFFSFHYVPDNWRASQVRNMGVIEGNQPASDNDWEKVVGGGNTAIQKWIDDQLSGRTCTVVLIGKDTADRKWINYEIEKSWKDGKGVLGIHIHNLKNSAGDQTTKGANPFKNIYVGDKKMSEIVNCHDSIYSSSTYVYDDIKENIEKWIEEAIKIRNNY